MAESDTLKPTFANILYNLFQLILVDLKDSDYHHPATAPPVLSFPTLHLVHRWPAALNLIPDELHFHLPHQSTDRHVDANDRWLRWVACHKKVVVDMTRMPYDGPRHRHLWRRLLHDITPTDIVEVRVLSCDHLDGLARAMTNDIHSRYLKQLILVGTTTPTEYQRRLPGGHYKQYRYELNNMYDKDEDFYGYRLGRYVPADVPNSPSFDTYAANSDPLEFKIINSMIAFRVEELTMESIGFRTHAWWDVVLEIIQNKHIRKFRYNEVPNATSEQGPYGRRLETLKHELEQRLLTNHTILHLDVPIKFYPATRVWWQIVVAPLLARNRTQLSAP
jgi:hypothetical protein